MEKKHYYSANDYYRNKFGCKVYRLAIDGGFTCPNRDGSKGYGGCTFCSESGSGDFTSASVYREKNITRQINSAKNLVAKKKPEKYLAYFQSFTNTYAEINELKEKYETALAVHDICALSIATRPDCINPEIARLISSLRLIYQKPIYVELGLQTIHDKTEKYLNRCYSFYDYEKALGTLNTFGIPVITHIMLGLPGENKSDMIESVRTAASGPIHGIKFSLLHILKDTEMEKLYFSSPELFHLTDINSYLDILGNCLINTPADKVIYRITGDAPKLLLTAPAFTADKKRVLNSINRYLKENLIFQGSFYDNPNQYNSLCTDKAKGYIS